MAKKKLRLSELKTVDQIRMEDIAKEFKKHKRLKSHYKDSLSSKRYTIEFDKIDTLGFYEFPARLPVAMLWNFDEALMAYVAAALTALANNGHTDWDYWDPSWEGANTRRETRKRMLKAAALAQRYVDLKNDMKDEDADKCAKKCFKLLIKIGYRRLWD